MKLSVNLFMTLDGVNQVPGAPDEDRRGGFDKGGWLMPRFDEGCGREVDRWFTRCVELLLGRYTFDTFSSYWSQVTDEGDSVANILRERPKHVVTSHPLGEVWAETSRRLSDDFLRDISLLKKQESDKELQVHGSIELARTLHQAGMIDSYRLLIAPVVVGHGSGIFRDGGPAYSMRVTHHEKTENGVTSLELEPGELVNDLQPVVRDGRSVVE